MDTEKGRLVRSLYVSKNVTAHRSICCSKITMFLAVFCKLLVLFFCCITAVVGQAVDNVASIELGQTNFLIERPFTISVIIPHSDTRPTVVFPDIAGFLKKGTSVSVTTSEVGGKTLTNQVITQNYQARAPGRFQVPSFTVIVNGEAVLSEGTLLVVRPSAQTTFPLNASLTAPVPPPNGAAFLSLRTSKSAIYSGEGVGLTVSFFVADNYPYELSFTALDKQLQAITKKIRPANAWEENLSITELTPVSVVIGGKKFREYRLYQSVFYPLSNQGLRLPAVSLWLSRRPVVGPPAPQPETVVFTSKPVAITVRPLPPHPLRGRVPVGLFQLEEGLERQRVGIGQSVRYTFAITGEGNIATLPAPATLSDSTAVDVFPPEERHTVNNEGNQVTGRKTFTYFIVPHHNGVVSLANRFQWIYFDPQTARYDTLRPHLQLKVGGSAEAMTANAGQPVDLLGTNGELLKLTPGGDSLYAGIEALDSTRQPISIPVLIRSIANVLIVMMLLGMIFVFFKK